MEKKGITLEVAAEEQIYKTINLFPLLRTTPTLLAASFYLSALSPAASLLCLSPPFSPESSSAFIPLIRLSCTLLLLTATPTISFTLLLLLFSSIHYYLRTFYHSVFIVTCLSSSLLPFHPYVTLFLYLYLLSDLVPFLFNLCPPPNPSIFCFVLAL